MHEILSAINELVKNGAFWTFLGVFATAYFGYREVSKRNPSKQVAKVKNASSFEELRAVVEVLQNELVKKDKRHKDDTDYMLSQLTEARVEIKRLRDLLLANGISE